MAKDRKCLCCGKTYRYCPSCSRADALKPAWYATFCCEECQQLWTICTKFNLGKVSKQEAKAQILSLNLKPIEEYAACIQRDLNKILVEDPKPRKHRVKQAEQQVIDEVAMDCQMESQVVESE